MNNYVFEYDDETVPKTIGSPQSVYNMLTNDFVPCVLVGIEQDEPLYGCVTYYLKSEKDYMNTKDSQYGNIYCMIIESDRDLIHNAPTEESVGDQYGEYFKI